jgi:perosamine synthetase
MIPVSCPSLSALERDLLLQAYDSTRLSMGPWVERFERGLEQMFHVEHAVATSSGTSALHLALLGLGVGPGDEILVPNLTFVATANAVLMCGATPVLVDVDPLTWTLDPALLSAAAGRHTRGLIAVHLYGRPAALQPLQAFCQTVGIWMLEDTAEACGSLLGGLTGPQIHCGTVGQAGVLSFYGNKHLTCGEGGAVLTHDRGLAETVRHLRGQAQVSPGEYWHDTLGWNYRLTDLQAAVGWGQLSRARDLIDRRRAVVQRYRTNLSDDFPHQADLDEDDGWVAWWMEVIVVSNRDQVRAVLADANIETRPGFVPLAQLPHLLTARDFPVSDKLGLGALCLPTFADLPLDKVDAICELVQHVAQPGADPCMR